MAQKLHIASILIIWILMGTFIATEQWALTIFSGVSLYVLGITYIAKRY